MISRSCVALSIACIAAIACIWIAPSHAQGFDLLKLLEQGPNAQAQDKQLEEFKKLVASFKAHSNAGRHAQALAIARRILAIIEKELGPNHALAGEWVFIVGALNKELKRYGEAEPLLKRGTAMIAKSKGANSVEHALATTTLGMLHIEQLRYDLAEPLFKRALAIREKLHGANHDEVALAAERLGQLYHHQGRYAEAEPLLKRTLAIHESRAKSVAPAAARDAQSKLANTLNHLGGMYYRQGRFAEAEPQLTRALSILQRSSGSETWLAGMTMNNLGEVARERGEYAKAEALFNQALAILEKTGGPDDPSVAQVLSNLGMLYFNEGKLSRAEPPLQRAVAIREKALSPDHPDLAQAINNLAWVHAEGGDFGRAEPLLKRALAIQEKAFGPEHRDVGKYISNLGSLYYLQGRLSEAEPALRRALAIQEKALGTIHADVAQTLNNMAMLYSRQKRQTEAEAFLHRVVAIHEAVYGQKHGSFALSLSNLAGMHLAAERHSEAEGLYVRALEVAERAVGPDHVYVVEALAGLAITRMKKERYAEAEPLLARSLVITERLGNKLYAASLLSSISDLHMAQGQYEKAASFSARAIGLLQATFGPEAHFMAPLLADDAFINLSRGDFAGALAQSRRSAEVVLQRTARGIANYRKDAALGEIKRSANSFHNLVRSAWGEAERNPSERSKLAREAFQAAQWAQGSEAAVSLSQMAARSSAATPAVASLMRERQDLSAEWQAKDKLITASRGRPDDQRNRAEEAQLSTRMAAIDARLGVIDRRMASEFPDYSSLANPAPLSVEDVQRQLDAGEALVLVLDIGRQKPLSEETFVWVVTKSEVLWLRSELGTESLKREVDALRCGLDLAAWATAEGRRNCMEHQRISTAVEPKPNEPPPFDHARAHRLYTALLGGAADAVKGRHLLVVATGPLSQLPLQVLVTAPPTDADHRKTQWLARSNAITVLPAVASLQALRRIAKPSLARKPMIGFANPLLDGDQADTEFGKLYKELADLARVRTGCTRIETQRTAERRGFPRSLGADLRLRARLDVAELRRQSPLPETADEVCEVARTLKADPGEIRIGARATEREIKALSASGQLAQYQVVHFATHGTVGGEIEGANEPGLIMTPPREASEQDDGYLSASEIAALKLDASWVILSACNTASGNRIEGAEALSGLARAFFHAQARALLVSHWAVESNATVRLVSGAIGESVRDAGVGRGEALRRAMLSLIDMGQPHEAHPAYWAPFVVVGEGGAGR